MQPGVRAKKELLREVARLLKRSTELQAALETQQADQVLIGWFCTLDKCFSDSRRYLLQGRRVV